MHVYDLSIIIDTNTGSDGLISTQVLPINTWNVKTESPTSIDIGTAQPSKLLIPLYVLGSIIVIVLCVLLGFAVVCKIKIINRQADSTNVDLQRETNSNREYCEIADTIYETISDNLADLGMQVKTANNDAYTENIQFHSSTGINVRNNDAYYVTNAVTVPMKQNSSESSYQANHLQHFPKLSVAIDSHHSDGSKKKDNNIDGTDLRCQLEDLCTSTTDSEYLRVTIQNKGDFCTDHIFDS